MASAIHGSAKDARSAVAVHEASLVTVSCLARGEDGTSGDVHVLHSSFDLTKLNRLFGNVGHHWRPPRAWGNVSKVRYLLA